MTEPAGRFTLRNLPLPAKLVLTVFLLTVGLGYSSAMVQLHFQHTKADGRPMPMVEDVVEVFAGKKKVDPNAPAPPLPLSKLEKLISGPLSGAPFNGAGSMAPAFFEKDPSTGPGNYRTQIRGPDGRRGDPDPALKTTVDAQREGERKVLQLWINTPDEQRRAAYEQDRFVPPEGSIPIISREFRDQDRGFKVRSIFNNRCVGCHGPGGAQETLPLETYDQIAKYLEVPPAPPTGGTWCPSDRQISKEKLAQSTHAHLLSFAMLFSLTGLIFAFTSYPASVRAILGPLVLLAQVADVSCWWLARLDGPGPYFAMCIIGTGGVVGLGLIAQIVLSTFNMYGPRGKLVVGGIFAAGLILGGLAYVTVIKPQLEEERRKADERRQAETPRPNETPRPDPVPKGKSPDKKTPVVMGPSRMEKVLTGQFVPGGPWGAEPGGMVRAFFDKDTEFRDLMKENDPKLLERVRAEREGERAVVLAWVRSDPAARKRAFEDNKFELPTGLQGKPITAAYQWDDRAVRVKELFADRCVKCHTEGSKAPSFETFDSISKFLEPEPVAAPADANPPGAPKADAATPNGAAVADDSKPGGADPRAVTPGPKPDAAAPAAEPKKQPDPPAAAAEPPTAPPPRPKGSG
jgi:mono/diheme cytochrome c family protein